jgi:transposase-like protein
LRPVRRYLRYWLSFREVEELLTERGLEADHLALRSALRSRTGTALRRQAGVPDMQPDPALIQP